MALALSSCTVFRLRQENFPRFHYFMTHLVGIWRNACALFKMFRCDAAQQQIIKESINHLQGHIRVCVVGNHRQKITSAVLTRRNATASVETISMFDCFSLHLHRTTDFIIFATGDKKSALEKSILDALVDQYGLSVFQKIIFVNCIESTSQTNESAPSIHPLLIEEERTIYPGVSFIVTNIHKVHTELSSLLEEKVFQPFISTQRCLRDLRDSPRLFCPEKFLKIEASVIVESAVINLLPSMNVLKGSYKQFSIDERNNNYLTQCTRSFLCSTDTTKMCLKCYLLHTHSCAIANHIKAALSVLFRTFDLCEDVNPDKDLYETINTPLQKILFQASEFLFRGKTQGKLRRSLSYPNGCMFEAARYVHGDTGLTCTTIPVKSKEKQANCRQRHSFHSNSNQGKGVHESRGCPFRMFGRKNQKPLEEIQVAVDGVVSQYCKDLQGRLMMITDRLYWEINGMFQQSTIAEVNDLMEEKRVLPEQVRQALFDRITSVRGCGYWFGKLKVLVDEDVYKSGSYDDVAKRVKNILVDFGITIFEIEPCPAKFTHLHEIQAGKEIRASVSGTLGGFAKFSDTEGATNFTICALVSKHVADGNNSLSLVVNKEGDTTIEIGERVPESTDDAEPKFDIAAFRIKDDFIKDTNTKLMNSNGDRKKSRLACLDDFPTTGRKVHIWGAKSKPGLGTIASDRFDYRESENSTPKNYILISDSHSPPKAFCQKGDSGSIVCADDPGDESIHVLSMLIGKSMQINMRSEEESGQADVRYMTFLLRAGLDDLQKRAGKIFTICNEYKPDLD